MLNIESVLSGLMGEAMEELGNVVSNAILNSTGIKFERLNVGSVGHEEPMFNDEFVNMFITPVFNDGMIVAYEIKCSDVEAFPELLNIPVVEGDEIYLAFEQFLVSKVAYNVYHDDLVFEDAYNV